MRRGRFGLGALATVAVIALAGPAPAAMAGSHGTPVPHRYPVAAMPGKSPLQSVAEAQVCAQYAAKAGFSFNNYISTNNGGSYPVIVIAVAIGMAESNCTATAQNPTSTATGMWQIEYNVHGISFSCAMNAQCNANDAMAISGGGYNWCQWATYNGNSNCSAPPSSGPSYVNELPYAEAGVYGYTITLQDQGAGTCIDADSSQAHSGGKIFQWSCNSGDRYQQWRVEGSDGQLPILRNVGTGTCLDAEAQQAYNGGTVFQWACNQSDPHQQWWFYGSKYTGTNNEARAGIHSQGTGKTCVDADGTNVGNGAPIFQWTCNQNDIYQEWN